MTTTTTMSNPSSSSMMNTTAQQPLYIDTQHENLVHDAQMDFYGSKLATASSDRTIHIYNVSDTAYERTATLTVHSGPVWQVAWAPPQCGTLLASCSLDGSIALHKEERPGHWTLLHHAVGLHASSVNSLAFAPAAAGLVLAAASADGRVSILRHDSSQQWTVEYISVCPTGVNAVHWDPESSSSSSSEQQSPLRFVAGCCDHSVRIYTYSPTTSEWQLAAHLPQPHTDWVRDVAWAPAWLPHHPVLASAAEDGAVYIWTTTTEQDSNDNETDEATTKWTATRMHTFPEAVWRLSWSVTGHLLAVSSGDATVTLWKRRGGGGATEEWTQVETAEPPQ